MKIFLGKLTLYLLLLGILLSMYVLIVFFRPDFVDYFYYRFTTPKANSLILGASRAAQGLKPETINNKLKLSDNNKIINHAFAGGPSSFGPKYYREIVQKLKKDSNNGIFIISVIPWNFCTSLDNIDDDSLNFYGVKNKLFVGNLKSNNSNPNFEYLWYYWNNKFSVFENSIKHFINYGGILQLHSNGWLEVNIPMDSVSRNNRVSRSTNEYIQKSEEVKWSETRYYYFEKILNYLENRGEIVLVRLPVSEGMAEIEKNKFPEFDRIIQKTANKYNIQYINYIKESGKYLTIDTHHLWKEESERITKQICDSILVYREKKAMIRN